MARTSSIYDHFDLYLTPLSLTFNLRKQMFYMALLLPKDNNCAKLIGNPCITVPVMFRTSSIHVYDHFDLYLTPVTLIFNLPKNVSNGTSPPQGQQLCQIVLNPYIIVQVRVRTNSDGTHTHQTKIVTTMSHLPASGLDKNAKYRLPLRYKKDPFK